MAGCANLSNQIAESVLESLFSKPRIDRYTRNPRGATASVAYLHNLQLAESMMPCLHILEVALRNAVDSQLRAKYGRQDWWVAAPTLTPQDIDAIGNAERKIQSKPEVIGWLEPQLKAWLGSFCRFSTVWQAWMVCTHVIEPPFAPDLVPDLVLP